MAANWFEINNVEEIDSPALIVFPERVQHNIDLAISMVGDVNRLRPHVKTHKSPDVARLMLRSGITKFKCATIAEAEMLAQCMAPDVLLAYQPLGPKLARFISLIKNYPSTKFACLTDNITAADEQSAAFNASGITISVFIDLNVGMNRTGISPGREAIELADHCRQLSGIRLPGLHAYDGHIRDIDFDARKRECDAVFNTVTALNDKLKLPHHNCRRFTHIFCSLQERKYRVQPGYIHILGQRLSRSLPRTEIFSCCSVGHESYFETATNKLCLDLGHKSVAAENEITRRVHFLNAGGLRPISQSEEHLVVETDEAESYQTGDVLYGLPFHICPTVALYERLLTVENGIADGEWKTIARDRKITI